MGVVHAEIVGGGFDETLDDGEEEYECELGEPEGYENAFLERGWVIWRYWLTLRS